MTKLIDPGLMGECFVPRCEVMKKFRGQWIKRAEILIPGYVFVQTKDPDKLKPALRSVPRFTRLLGNDDMFTPLDDREMAFVQAFTSPGARTVAMSTGIIEGDEVVILNGPLVGHSGMIRKIDRHKRLAYLEMEILGRRKAVKLGLEIVTKRS